jgi:alanine dehydrogenase
VITDKKLKEISEVRKKIIIDISIDQGGNFPYIDPSGNYAPNARSSILNPGIIDSFGNTFVRVPNIPSVVPLYASRALSQALSGYILDIVKGNETQQLVRATSISHGKILDPAIAEAHNLK